MFLAMARMRYDGSLNVGLVRIRTRWGKGGQIVCSTLQDQWVCGEDSALRFCSTVELDRCTMWVGQYACWLLPCPGRTSRLSTLEGRSRLLSMNGRSTLPTPQLAIYSQSTVEQQRKVTSSPHTPTWPCRRTSTICPPVSPSSPDATTPMFNYPVPLCLPSPETFSHSFNPTSTRRQSTFSLAAFFLRLANLLS